MSYSVDPASQEVKIMEENHYYPFGLKHTNYNSDWLIYGRQNESTVLKKPGPIVKYEPVYKYKYNGKEYQDEMGLNVTAMDFRQYDSALGRFNGMDRLSEMTYSITPYRFAFNNPVKWNDPSGLLEGGGDEDKADVDGGMLELVVVTSYTTSSSKEIKRPANFNYSLIDKNKPHRGVSMEEYNSIKGTNYKTFDDYYFNEKYKPAYRQNISNIHSATNSAAVAVLTTAAVLTGSALAMPVVASASPAISSFTASALTNPLVQDKLLDVGSNVASQLWVNNGDINQVNIVEASMSALNGPGAATLGEMVNVNANSISEGNMFERSSNTQTGIAVVGGLGSYAFGQATDAYLSDTGWKGKVIGLCFKFLVESASNAAPNLVPDEK